MLGIALALLVTQPDASQATALAIAGSLALTGVSGQWRAAVTAGAALLAVLAWTRPDPLAPVAMVEDVLRIGWSDARAPTVVAVAVLAFACLAPWLSQRGEPRDQAGLALSAYFAAVVLMTFFGPFPVPLVGFGVSFPLGWWLGYAFLCADARSRQALEVPAHP